jgi:hypothetical protein
MNSERLRQLIDRYHLGIASEDEVAELDAELREDSQSRDVFIAAARLETNLYDEAINAIPADESDGDPVSRRLPLRVIGAVAAMVCLAILVASLVGGRGPKPIATLASSENAAWESELPTTPGAELVPGSLRLISGIATIRFHSGAEVVLEAPAQLVLESPMRGRLLVGAAVIDVPDSAIGFVMETPNGYAVDHGTRFSVVVDKNQQTSSFEVIDGEISVHTSEAKDEVRLTHQQAVAITNGAIATIDPTDLDGTLKPTADVVRIGTNGQATSATRGHPKARRRDMLLVKQGLPEYRDFDRRSVLAFKLDVIDWDSIRSARLRLNLVPSGIGFAARLPKANRFEVFGITNDTALNWRVGSDWESIPAPEDGVLLGTFDIPRSQQRGVFGIETEALLEFLNSQGAGRVSFLITRQTTELQNRSLVHAFASDSHPEASGPILELAIRNTE